MWNLLADRRCPIAAAIVGVALVLPSLHVGLQLDDYVHQMILSRAPGFADLSSSPLDIFNFLDGDRERTRRIVDLGLVPWWTLEDARVAFWRPASALTHWLDYRLWPRRPALMHLQSLLWYGALVAAVGFTYRQLIGPVWAAGLAALFYAVDASHGFPVGWLANRNALLGALFGALTLLAHDRWRRSGWRPGAWVGPLCLLLGLLSAETAIATAGYLVAHAVFLDRGPIRSRILALLPSAAVVLLWHLVYRHLGYGTWGASPLYIDPVLEPALFARAVVERGPTLLLIQWALPSLESYGWILTAAPGLMRIAVPVFFLLLAVAFARLLWGSARARFWAVGQLLALIPACATLPHGRQLFFVGLGAMGLLAEFLSGLVTRRRPIPRRLWLEAPALAIGVFLVVVHGILSPLELPSAARGPAEFERIVEGFGTRFPSDPAIARQDLVIVNAPDAYLPSFLHLYRVSKGEAVPARTRRLASATTPVEVSRRDARTLVIRQAGGLFPQPADLAFRSEDFPMTRGQRIELTALTVEVTEVTADGRPAEVAFRFAVPLEDPSLRWLVWRSQNLRGYVPFSPPPIGQTMRLE